MTMTGGCYCGAVRYEAGGDPVVKAQCHCRECQYISGGGPNYFMLMPKDGFHYTQGEPAQFSRSDLEVAVTREFCPTCGTHLLTRLPAPRQEVVIKIGTLDDPVANYGGPKIAIYCCDKQPYHLVPDGLPEFERLPPR